MQPGTDVVAIIVRTQHVLKNAIKLYPLCDREGDTDAYRKTWLSFAEAHYTFAVSSQTSSRPFEFLFTSVWCFDAVLKKKKTYIGAADFLSLPNKLYTGTAKNKVLHLSTNVKMLHDPLDGSYVTLLF